LNTKILFVCFIESVHSAKWINQLRFNSEFEVQIYPSKFTFAVHSELNFFKIIIPFGWVRSLLQFLKLEKYDHKVAYLIAHLLKKYSPNYFEKRLEEVIFKFQPDIVHTLETQHAGYLYNLVYSRNSLNKVKWVHSNWGSDIQLFSKIREHKSRISSILSNIDYYFCECNRDVDLAFKLGFKGVAFDPYPNTGGFELQKLIVFKNNSSQTSKRKVILLKGYQGWAGRSLVGIRALERCSDLLNGYTIKLFSVSPYATDVFTSVSLFVANTGLIMEILPPNLSHNEMLLLHSSARISIGLSVGDGISTSLLEAMAMGSFPIQSNSSCCNEWFENGVSGFSVNAEDPEMIEICLREALVNNELVDSASKLNFDIIAKRADQDKLTTLTLNNYRKILS
jgi:glycosyltransferase involved in cell wall biosynthesis